MDDFEAALAAKLAPAEEAGTTGEDPEPKAVAEAAQTDESVEVEEIEPEADDDKLRDEKGRFVAKERPEWLPEKFKSKEELARSYG